jgi:hypothetical protein
MESTLTLGGTHTAKLIKGTTKAPVSWRVRNALRPSYLYGYAFNKLAKAFSALTGIPTMTAELAIKLIKADGRVIDYGVVGYRVVTTAFVSYVVDQLQTETSTFGDFKFHAMGTGSTAENAADTAMETDSGVARNSGSQTEASATVYQSVGTLAFVSTLALREHGLFNVLTVGTLMDRTVFAAINVVSGDSVQNTYSLTIAAGG